MPRAGWLSLIGESTGRGRGSGSAAPFLCSGGSAADLRRVDELLAAVEESGLLDLSRPVGLMLVAVLHFVSDEEDVEGLLRAYLARLAPGSAMAISHISPGGADSERLDEAVDIYSAATPPGVHLRTAEQVTRLFDGTTLLPPGVVPIADWHPRRGDDTRPTAATGACSDAVTRCASAAEDVSCPGSVKSFDVRAERGLRSRRWSGMPRRLG
nr:SAM-dependent methyltransferase [Actinocorallia populi]